MVVGGGIPKTGPGPKTGNGGGGGIGGGAVFFGGIRIRFGIVDGVNYNKRLYGRNAWVEQNMCWPFKT